MRVVAWIFNLLLFLIALGFALSNTTVTELRFFLFGDGFAWRAPLVIFLLLFFVAGAVVGLLAAFPSFFRNRRELARLRRELRLREARENESAAAPDVLPPDAPAIPPRISG
ncbi:MAG: lipopolysaccharide assembly protein LapA domain-containing protein [Burkholderiaceae bacterium]